jgi:hypothetical protein
MAQLSRATDRAFGVAAIRIAVGVVAIGASVARGVDIRSALLGAVLGAVVLTLLAHGQSSRTRHRPEPEWVPVPAEVAYDPSWRAALLACIPSTLGVAAMTAFALVREPVLAGILAGVLFSLGVLALISGFELRGRERSEGVRLYLGRGPRPARYVASR